MSQLGDYKCAGGYLCIEGGSLYKPLNSICPKHVYCPSGAIHEMHCSDGSYSFYEGGKEAAADGLKRGLFRFTSTVPASPK